MVKSAFHEFTAFRVHHRNLLEARMKIYPYNQHPRLLSSRVLVSYALPSLLGLGEEPTLLSNQFHSEPPVVGVIAFHEKAGRSQVNSFGFLFDKVFSGPSSHCRHAS